MACRTGSVGSPACISGATGQTAASRSRMRKSTKSGRWWILAPRWKSGLRKGRACDVLLAGEIGAGVVVVGPAGRGGPPGDGVDPRGPPQPQAETEEACKA